MSYTERDIIELAIRAPACPEWFKPDMAAYTQPSYEQFGLGCIDFWPTGNLSAEKIKEWKEARSVMNEWSRLEKSQRLAQWPKAYARMVLEAA